MYKRHLKAKWYNAVSQYSLLPPLLTWWESWTINHWFQARQLSTMLENQLETQNQHSESLFCKTYFFIPDSRKSGTWKHVWETQATLLQWARPNGINTVATSSSRGWGLPLFFVLKACDRCIFTVPHKKCDWSSVSSSVFSAWLTKPTMITSLP